MKECCKGKTTPYCADCGTPVKGYPLIEIKVYFEGRLKGAQARLKARQAELRDPDKTNIDSVAKVSDEVAKWDRWVNLISQAIERWDANRAGLSEPELADGCAD